MRVPDTEGCHLTIVQIPNMTTSITACQTTRFSEEFKSLMFASVGFDPAGIINV
jgi:hypothetical protein